MSAGPAGDAEVQAYVAGLGLPGIVDVHTHFMPKPVMDKVWAFFDAAEERFGRPWPITYRCPEEERLEILRGFGVLRFSSMVYAHRPAMAEWLNDWAVGFAAQHPDVLQTMTFHPEPGVDDYAERALRAGARIVKLHVQVGGYDPRDALLSGVWGMLEDAGVPVVIHCGSGPHPGAFTGPGPISEVLATHPRLCLVIAHMGMPEYADFLGLARRHPRVHLDTTMAFVDYSEELMPFPPRLRADLLELGDRVLFGSDFPNIPHPFAHQVAALARLDLGDDWLRGVLHGNASRLFEL